jgi:hypothetical protein
LFLFFFPPANQIGAGKNKFLYKFAPANQIRSRIGAGTNQIRTFFNFVLGRPQNHRATEIGQSDAEISRFDQPDVVGTPKLLVGLEVAGAED